MSEEHPLLRGISASFTTVATRIAVLFVTLPIFFSSWTMEAIGGWFILFALPAYLVLIGNGFAGAGSATTLAAASEGDMARARKEFRAAWTTSTGSIAALALVFATLAMVLIPSVLEHGKELAVWDLAKAAAWLSLYIFATGQMAIFEIPYRLSDIPSDHNFLYNATSLLEIVVVAAAVTFSDSLATLAMSLALFRCVAALWIYLSARKAVPQMFERTPPAPQPGFGELWRPSLALILLPLAFGLNLQGYVLLVGAGFGAVMLAVFVATRALTRLLDLITHALFGLQLAESGHFEGERRTVERRVLATISLASFGIAALFTLTLLSIGPWLQDLYTLGKTLFDPTLAIVLVTAATLRALSTAPMAVLAAEEEHGPVLTVYLAASAIALVLAALLALGDFSLPAVVSPLILAEGSLLVTAMRRALATLEMSPEHFIASLGSRERIDDARVLWNAVARKPDS